MIRKLRVLAAFSVGIGVGLVAGCQTYDFEPVQPLAIAQQSKSVPIAGRRAKPNLMLLVDKSGSMDDAITPSLPACNVGGSPCGPAPQPACPTASCPTRWSEMKKAMNGFLTNFGTVGRMGLLFFPASGGDGCVAPTLADIKSPTGIPMSASNDVDTELQKTANDINALIQSTSPGGGTPTGNALQVLGNYTPLLDQTQGRDQFIVLLTDGLPNCNANNPNDYTTNAAACRCTLAGAVCNAPYTKKGCLDKDNTVLQVQALKAKGIKTVVIGFGADVGGSTGDAPETLNAMANAGGFPRICPNGTDAECGGSAGACDVATKTCVQKFYQASNGDDLGKALADISKRVGVDACSYTLESQPTDDSLLTVIVNGETKPPGPDTWKYDKSTGKVIFQGALCTQLASATESDPINVEFRVVQTL